MPFQNTWQYLQTNLTAGMIIHGKSYLNPATHNDFTIKSVNPSSIEVTLRNKRNVVVPKDRVIPINDFIHVYNLWNGYSTGVTQRQVLRVGNHNTVYIISMFYYVESLIGSSSPCLP